MRIFTEGAEMGDYLFWDSVGAYVALQTGRSGNWCYYNWYRYSGFTKDISALSELYLRVAFYPTTTIEQTWVVNFYNGGTSVASVVPSSQKLHYYAGTDDLGNSDTFSLSVWHLLEVHLKIADSPDGVFTVKLDGITDMDYSGDTLRTAYSTVNKLYFDSREMGFDDLALNDTTGDFDNSWCGDGHVVKITPSGSGTLNEFSNSGGTSTSNNYLYVDEFGHDSDTTYVYSSGSIIGTKQDQYKMSSFSVSGAVIKRIFPITTVRKTQAGDNYFKLGYLPNGGTVQLSGSIPASLIYGRYAGTSASTNPVTGLPWTNSEVSNLEYVIEKE
jgi:hypothetical protein